MKSWLRTVLLIFFAGVFLVSGYFLTAYFWESGKQKSAFNELAKLMEQSTVPSQTPNGIPAVPGSPGETAQDPPESVYVSVQDPETGETVELLPEFAQLYVMNNDIVGWMSIDGTNVNYPVMQTPDSVDFYLYKDFDKNYSRHGCIYVREVCDVFAPSDNLTIYGHRMGDGTMFNDLHRYEKKSFWEDHRYITFNTLKQRQTYEIIFVFRIESSLDSPFLYHLFVDAADQDHFASYIENCRSYALYDTDVDVTYGDKLITLSTCEYTRTNGRFVVVAKRISE